MSGSGFSWSRDRFATTHILCHFASAKTFCADRKPSRFAVNQSTYLLKVGIPAPFGGIIVDLPYFTPGIRVSSNVSLVKIMNYQKLCKRLFVIIHILNNRHFFDFQFADILLVMYCYSNHLKYGIELMMD